MKMKKTISILTAFLLLAALLTGCGSSSGYAYDSASTEAAYAYDDNGYYYDAAVEEADWYGEDEIATTSYDTDPSDVQADTGDKIIYTAYLNIETTDFDNAIAALENMVSELGGYIQDSSVDGYVNYNDDGTSTVIDRYATYTVAIPCEKFETALSNAGTIGNVTSKSRNAQNITSQYTDVELRIESLKVQEERIMAMMEETDDIESLIALEERLSEITYELESYQRTLNDYDRQVAYSTITFQVNEVEVYTPTVPVTRTFGEKFADAFKDGWTSFGRGMQAFVLFLVEALPVLILLGLIVTGTVHIIRACVRHKRKKRAAAAAKQTEAQ